MGRWRSEVRARGEGGSDARWGDETNAWID